MDSRHIIGPDSDKTTSAFGTKRTLELWCRNCNLTFSALSERNLSLGRREELGSKRSLLSGCFESCRSGRWPLARHRRRDGAQSHVLKMTPLDAKRTLAPN